jgi:hypothetical protein
VSFSQPLSSSKLSQEAPNLNHDYSVTSTGELSDSSQSLPIIRSRSHVLDGMPEDIKHYWLYDFVLNWNASRPADIAKTLHHMATISKEHQQEVIGIVQNVPGIAMDYTAHAMRGLAENAITLLPKEKARARRYLMVKFEGVVNDNDVDAYNFGKKVKDFAELYPTSSVNLGTQERKEFNKPEWLRAVLQEFLNPAIGSKRVRFDFSVQQIVLVPLQKRNSIFSQNNRNETVYIPRKVDEVRGSPIRIISELCTKFKNNSKQIYSGPIIELIIKNNIAAVHEIDKLPAELHIDLIDASGMRASSVKFNQTPHRNNSLYLVGGFDLAPLSAYLAKSSCKLMTLILHDCNLDTSALTELATGLEKNTSLKMLDLSKNLIRGPGINGPHAYDGLMLFTSILTTSANLLHVNLANCSLHDEGATILHQVLKPHPLLKTTFNVSGNMISHNHAIWDDTRFIGGSRAQVNLN